MTMIEASTGEVVKPSSEPNPSACLNQEHILPSWFWRTISFQDLERIGMDVEGVVHRSGIDNFPLLYGVKLHPRIDAIRVEALAVDQECHTGSHPTCTHAAAH